MLQDDRHRQKKKGKEVRDHGKWQHGGKEKFVCQVSQFSGFICHKISTDHRLSVIDKYMSEMIAFSLH